MDEERQCLSFILRIDHWSDLNRTDAISPINVLGVADENGVAVNTSPTVGKACQTLRCVRMIAP